MNTHGAVAPGGKLTWRSDKQGYGLLRLSAPASRRINSMNLRGFRRNDSCLAPKCPESPSKRAYFCHLVWSEAFGPVLFSRLATVNGGGGAPRRDLRTPDESGGAARHREWSDPEQFGAVRRIDVPDQAPLPDHGERHLPDIPIMNRFLNGRSSAPSGVPRSCRTAPYGLRLDRAAT